MFVAAYGKDLAAELGPSQDKPGQQHQNDHVEHGDCDTEKPRATAECQKLVMIGPKLENDWVARSDHGKTSRDRQHAERHHEGWQIDISDQYSVASTYQQGGGNCGSDSDFDTISGMLQTPGA